jgi:hypothetical protein
LWSSFSFIKTSKSFCEFLVIHNKWHFVWLHIYLVVFFE